MSESLQFPILQGDSNSYMLQSLSSISIFHPLAMTCISISFILCRFAIYSFSGSYCRCFTASLLGDFASIE